MIHLYLSALAVTVLVLFMMGAIWFVLRNPTIIRYLPGRYKTKLGIRLQRAADEHEYNRRWAKTQRAYHLLTLLDPAIPRFWRGKAIAHLEDQDPRQALETLQDAYQALALPDPNLLELEILAHQDLDDAQQAQHALRRLAELNPEQAQDFIFDLQLHDLADDPAIQQAIGPNPGGGGIDGYV